MLTLYTYFRSSAAYRARIGLHLKQLTYRDAFIHLAKGVQHTEDYRRINPQALIPSLQLEDGTVLTQSLAILEYLDTVYPEPAFIPEDPLLAARVRAFALTIACDIHPLNNLKVFQFLNKQYQIRAVEDGWYEHWLLNGLNVLEEILPETVIDTGYCFGNAPTMADIFLIPQLYNAKRFNMPIATFPKLFAVNQHCLTIPAFIKASPEQQTDYEP